MGILDDWQDPIEDRTFGEAVGDYGTSLKQGFVSAGSGLVSLVDMATPGDLRGWLHETIGYSPEKMNKQYQLDKSAYQQDEELAANSGEGFLGTVKSYAQHPAAIGSGIVETAPYMLAGGALGRVALGLAPGMGVAAASGLGEGLITAGSQEAQMYDEQGGQTSLEQKGLALGSGALTGIIGGVTGRVASKLGFNDKDFFLTAGLPAMAKKLGGEPAKNVHGIAARILGSGLGEAFQEATQTGQEAMVMNAALGKTIFEGVPQQIGQAVAVAGPTGGAMGVLHAPAVEAMAEFEEGSKKVEKTDELGFRKVKDVLEGEALKDSARQKLNDLKWVEDETQKPIDGSPLAGATSSPASTEFLNEDNQDGLRVSDVLQPQKETVDEYLSNTRPEIEPDTSVSPDRVENPGQAEVIPEEVAPVVEAQPVEPVAEPPVVEPVTEPVAEVQPPVVEQKPVTEPVTDVQTVEPEIKEQTPEEFPAQKTPKQDLNGIEVNVPERIEGTDKQIEVKKDAALARTELADRVEVYKKIADCIGL